MLLEAKCAASGIWHYGFNTYMAHLVHNMQVLTVGSQVLNILNISTQILAKVFFITNSDFYLLKISQQTSKPYHSETTATKGDLITFHFAVLNEN